MRRSPCWTVAADASVAVVTIATAKARAPARFLLIAGFGRVRGGEVQVHHGRPDSREFPEGMEAIVGVEQREVVAQDERVLAAQGLIVRDDQQ